MSGGVDSTVAAILLKKEGYNVVGVHMKNWDYDEESVSTTATTKRSLSSDLEDLLIKSSYSTKSGSNPPSDCGERNWRLVQDICKILDIPCIRMNFTKEYWTSVFDPFLADLANAKTPNPDIACNSQIKFGAFYERCRDVLKSDYIAFGHYARVEHDHISGRARLFRGIDPVKDQTFFLSATPSTILNKTLFPLGPLQKTKVKDLAQSHHPDLIPIALQKESMGICFIGKRNFGDFVGEYMDPKPGRFLTPSGTVLGTHKGAFRYTIGQRAHLAGLRERVYVVDKIGDDVVVVDRDHPSLKTRVVRVRVENLFGGVVCDGVVGGDLMIKLRHADQPVDVADISDDLRCGVEVDVSFHDDVGRVGRGQMVSIYRKSTQELLAGCSVLS